MRKIKQSLGVDLDTLRLSFGLIANAVSDGQYKLVMKNSQVKGFTTDHFLVERTSTGYYAVRPLSQMWDDSKRNLIDGRLYNNCLSLNGFGDRQLQADLGGLCHSTEGLFIADPIESTELFDCDLRLRPLLMDDADQCLHFLWDNQQGAYDTGFPYIPEDKEQFYRWQSSRAKYIVVAVTPDDQIKGMCGGCYYVPKGKIQPCLSLFYLVGQDYQGRGVATHLSAEMMALTRELVPQIEDIQIFADSNNIKSQSVAKKFGLERDPDLDYKTIVNGVSYDLQRHAGLIDDALEKYRHLLQAWGDRTLGCESASTQNHGDPKQRASFSSMAA